MKFLEAVEALKDGKQVVRTGWKKEEGYLTFMPGMKNIWKITLTPTVNAGNNLFSVEDFLADDWEIANFEEKCNEEHKHDGVCEQDQAAA